MNVKKVFNIDRITVILCICIIALGFYLLETNFSFFDFFQKNKTSNKNSIGKIQIVKSDARLKNSKQFFWADAKRNDVINLGDSIFVGDQSSVQIIFNDGSKMIIAANSLIKFNSENKKLKLSLQYGSVKTEKTSDQLVLDDCGKSIDLEGKNASLEIGKTTDCGDLKVNIAKGDVKVNNSDFNLKKSANMLIKSSSMAQLKELPKVNETILKLEDIAPKIEIDQLSESTENKKTALPAEIEKTIKETEQKIIEAPMLPPKLVSNEIIHTVGQNQSAKVNWHPATNAQKYIVEYTDDPNFNDYKTTETFQTEFDFGDITDPVYYRLKSISRLNNISKEYSTIGKVNINFPKIAIKDPPLKDLYIATSNSDPGVEKKFTVNFSSVPTADKYLIELGPNNDFTKSLKFQSRSPSSIIKVPAPGKYGYRVKAFDSKNRMISSSDKMGSISYARVYDLPAPTTPPEQKSQIYYFQKGIGKFIWIRWSAAKYKNAKYEVYISKDIDFKNIVKKYSTNNTKYLIQEELTKGKYFWKIRYFTNDNGPLQESTWSEINEININSTD